MKKAVSTRRQADRAGYPTPSSSHPAGSPLTASSVQACASLSYMAPRPCLLACSLRSHICSQASSAQPELAPCTRPHIAPLLQVAPSNTGTTPPGLHSTRPSGVCLPSPPPGHGHLPRWSSACLLTLPASSVVPTGKQLPYGLPKPILHLTRCSQNSPFPLQDTVCT